MKKIVTIILYLLILALITSCIFIYYFEKKISKNLLNGAEKEVEYITTLVMNNSIKKYTTQNNFNNLIDYKTKNNGDIYLINYNTIKINQILTDVTELLEKDLYKMTRGNLEGINSNTITKEYYEKIKNGLVFTIPLGSISGYSLLTNIGPKIPIKLRIVGNIKTNIEPKITEYGLNNAMIEINLKIVSKIAIQLPFISKNILVETKVPLTIEMIQGNIPSYYLKS